MNRFYIEKLMVSGGGHHASIIDFKPGLNFILGPSGSMSILWTQKVELFSQHNICRENYFLGC